MRISIVLGATAGIALSAGCRDTARPHAPAVTSPAAAKVPGTVVLEARGGAMADRGDGGVTAQREVFTLELGHEHARSIDHAARAKDLARSGDLPGAVAELRRALQHDPSSRETLEMLGRYARRSGDVEMAVAAYERQQAVDPADAVPALRLARIRLSHGDVKAARAAADEAARRDPSSAEAHHLCGRVALAEGRIGDAIDAFARATEIDPGHVWAFNNLGYANLLAGRNEQAANALEEAVALEPGVATMWNSLGVAYERQGEAFRALAAYAKALELRPKYVKAQINSLRAARVAEATETGSDVAVMPGVAVDDTAVEPDQSGFAIDGEANVADGECGADIGGEDACGI